MCCRVLPQKNLCCLVILSPFKKSALYTFVLFWGQGFSLGQDKIRSGFHTGHGWFFFCLLGGHVFFGLFLGAACLSNLCGGLPRLAKIRFAFLRSALRARLFLRLAPPLCGCFLGFRGSVSRRLAVFLSLSLSRLLLFLSFFLVFGAATLFLMPRPLLRWQRGSRAFWPPGLLSTSRPGERASARPAVVAGCRHTCLPHDCELLEAPHAPCLWGTSFVQELAPTNPRRWGSWAGDSVVCCADFCLLCSLGFLSLFFSLSFSLCACVPQELGDDEHDRHDHFDQCTLLWLTIAKNFSQQISWEIMVTEFPRNLWDFQSYGKACALGDPQIS